MNKRGSSVLKAFRRRWFDLRREDRTLLYFTSQDTAQPPRGAIHLSNATAIEAFHDWPGAKPIKHPWVFAIKTLPGRTYFLSAPSRYAKPCAKLPAPTYAPC